MKEILVLYYSRHGAVRALAEQIAQGIHQVAGVTARMRTVPGIFSTLEGRPEEDAPEHIPYATAADLSECIGLALGSPARFGSMAAEMKYFFDGLTGSWASGALEGKPAIVFTSSGSMHGGQESTLLSMMLPLMHHGMVIAGIPYSEPDLNTTRSGGTPYGITHVSGINSKTDLSDEEGRLALAAGRRLALIACRLDPRR